MGDSNKTLYLLIGNSILHWLRANRDKNNTIHSSGTKNKAPLLIIQGTEFNYMENIKHFPNREKKIKKSWRWAFQVSLMLQQCPLPRLPNSAGLVLQTPHTSGISSLGLFLPEIQHFTKPNSANFLQDEYVTYAVQHCSHGALCSVMATNNFKDCCGCSNTSKKQHLRSESLRSHSQDPSNKYIPKDESA